MDNLLVCIIILARIVSTNSATRIGLVVVVVVPVMDGMAFGAVTKNVPIVMAAVGRHHWYLRQNRKTTSR